MGSVGSGKNDDLSFLTQTQLKPFYPIKPQNLPYSEIVKDSPNRTKSAENSRNIGHVPDFTPGYVKGSARLDQVAREKRTNGNHGEVFTETQTTKVPKSIALSSNFQVKLKKTANVDQPMQKRNGKDPEFDKMEEIYDPRFSVNYSNLCKYLALMKVSFGSTDNGYVGCRKSLLNQCPREFVNDIAGKLDKVQRLEDAEDAETNPNVSKSDEEASTDTETKLNQKSLTDIRFITELLKLNTFTAIILHDCLEKLQAQEDEDKTKSTNDQQSCWPYERGEHTPKVKSKVHQMPHQNTPEWEYQLHQPKSSHRRPKDKVKPVTFSYNTTQSPVTGWRTNGSSPKLRLSKVIVEDIQLGPGGQNFKGWSQGSSGTSRTTGQEKQGRSLDQNYCKERDTNIHDRISHVKSRKCNLGSEPLLRGRPGMHADEIEKRTKSLLDEFLRNCDIQEAICSISELCTSSTICFFVTAALNSVLERSASARSHVAQLIHDLITKKYMSVDQYIEGLQGFLSAAEDYVIDVPHFWDYVGELIAPLIQDGTLPLINLREVVQSCTETSLAGEFISAVLHALARNLGTHRAGELWKCSGLSWTYFLDPHKNQRKFIEDNRLEFTMDTISKTQDKELSIEEIKPELKIILGSKNYDNEYIFDWIHANVSKNRSQEPAFIRALTSVICQSSIDETTLKIDEKILRERSKVLLRYLDHKEELEVQGLFALQALMHCLEHPKGILHEMFNLLFDEDVISEDAFFLWKKNDDPGEQEGKGIALNSVRAFFAWLKEMDNESVEES